MEKCEADFFLQSTLTVARSLLGQRLVFHHISGYITETEAYVGQDDPACHAARGLTNRTRVMFGPPGHSYVYLIYGMYHCLNIVTEAAGYPAAVLIRGLYIPSSSLHLNGPGKLCRHLGITRQHNDINMTIHPEFYVEHTGKLYPCDATPRIGIKVGVEKPWRFVIDPASHEWGE